MKGSLRGTTFTGHPIRTTFGNTMRMYYYTKYARSFIGDNDIRQFHAGDDVLLIGKPAYLDKLQAVLQNLALDAVPSTDSYELGKSESVSFGLG
jgi:hypothetical protein